MMEALSLASKYVCPVCGFLPEYPYAAEDGFFYHEICIEDIFDRACDGAITSPATKRPMGKKLVFAKTIQSFIEKLAKNEEVNRKYVRREAEDATKMVGKIEERAQVGSARDMALLGRWHLFCEQDGLECKGDVDGLAYGYHLCKNAADKDGVDGMACQGMCLIHGHGVGQNWSEGFELLIDAANEGSAYKLGSFYYAGVHGFKEDHKRALKWLTRAKSKLSGRPLDNSEMENVCKYLRSISPDSVPLSSTTATGTLPTVPENIDVKSISTMSTIGMTSASGPAHF